VAEALGKLASTSKASVALSSVTRRVGHVLVADAAKARQALQSGGPGSSAEQEALVVEIEDKPGALAS